MASVIMPQLGETVAEGKILAWLKSVGDEIKAGDNLFEVETDKVTVEVQAIVDGRLNEIRVPAGTVAKVGEVVATVGDDAAAAPGKPAPDERPTPAPLSPFEEVRTPTQRFGSLKDMDGMRATPLARRLMAQNGLNIATVADQVRRLGGRRIDEKAVREALAAPISAPLPAPASPPLSGGEVVPLNPIRRRTAERLADNWRNIPHVFQAIDVDFTEIDRLRRSRREAFQAEHGFALTFLPFIARACCLALSAFPRINARFDGASLTLSRDIHIGIAVDLDHEGLVVPVVRHAADLTLTGLAKAMRRQIEKARAGRLGPDDLTGGTYSISNNGAFGTTFTAPIINAPQVAILSADAIKLKPGLVRTPAGDFVAPRMMGMVGQSFDHRAFDGAYSAAFLSRLKTILEERNWAEELGS